MVLVIKYRKVNEMPLILRSSGMPNVHHVLVPVVQALWGQLKIPNTLKNALRILKIIWRMSTHHPPSPATVLPNEPRTPGERAVVVGYRTESQEQRKS